MLPDKIHRDLPSLITRLYSEFPGTVFLLVKKSMSFSGNLFVKSLDWRLAFNVEG